MKRLSIICTGLALCSINVLANLYGTDDFNDNTMDPAKWSVLRGDSLTEANSRLEFYGGTGDVLSAWGWGLNTGSYVQDWTVAVDVVNTVDETTLTLSDQKMRIGLIALNPITAVNSFSVSLFALGNADGSPPHRLIHSNANANNQDIPDYGVVTTETSLRLQLSFDAETKVLTSYYDTGGGLTVLTNFDAGSFGMADSDVFTISVFGESFDVTAVSGEVYGDNFVAVPEPGTLGLLMVGAGGLLLARDKRRFKSIMRNIRP